MSSCLTLRRDGQTRCFAFLGYKTGREAQDACKFFNRTFMDTSRLSVAMAESFKSLDVQKVRPWSKYSKGSKAYDTLHAPKHADGKSISGTETKRNKLEGVRCLLSWSYNAYPSHYDETVGCVSGLCTCARARSKAIGVLRTHVQMWQHI
jgi:RNA recognition motif-containing protein